MRECFIFKQPENCNLSNVSDKSFVIFGHLQISFPTNFKNLKTPAQMEHLQEVNGKKE